MKKIILTVGAALMLSACGPMPGMGTITKENTLRLNLSDRVVVHYHGNDRIRNKRMQRVFDRWLDGRLVAGRTGYPHAFFIRRHNETGKIRFRLTFIYHDSGPIDRRAILTKDKDHHDQRDSVQERCEYFKTYTCTLFATATRAK